MESININLSENQKDKIKRAFKKKIPVIIQFKYDQLNNGNDNILLTQRQKNKLEKCMKNKQGLRIELSYNQLKEIKDGGLLKEILDMSDFIPVVNKVTPYVRKGAKVVKTDVIPVIRNIIDWLDKELEGIHGSGLCEKTLKHVKKNLKKL